MSFPLNTHSLSWKINLLVVPPAFKCRGEPAWCIAVCVHALFALHMCMKFTQFLFGRVRMSKSLSFLCLVEHLVASQTDTDTQTQTDRQTDTHSGEKNVNPNYTLMSFWRSHVAFGTQWPDILNSESRCALHFQIIILPLPGISTKCWNSNKTVLPGKMPGLFWAADACLQVASACVFTSLQLYPLSLWTCARIWCAGFGCRGSERCIRSNAKCTTENASGRRESAPSYWWTCARIAWAARVCLCLCVCVCAHQADRPCLWLYSDWDK